MKMEYLDGGDDFVDVKINVGMDESSFQNAGGEVKIEGNDYVDTNPKCKGVTVKPEFDINLEYDINEEDDYVYKKEDVDVKALKFEEITIKTEFEDYSADNT